MLRAVDNGTTLTLGPGLTVRRGSNAGSPGSIGYNPNYGGNAAVSVVNLGTISADTSGRTIRISGQSFSNQGDIEVATGALLDANGSLVFDGLHRLDTQPDGRVEVSGNLSGNTRASDLYLPLGTTVFDGAGTSVSPQSLEVMAQDFGMSGDGFNRNFSYGTIALANNTYVRLVDQADNAPGTNAEALYVNSLVISTGSTLDLNGLHLYTRAAQIDGSIAGGAIIQIPDSGVIAFGIPTPGKIAVAGELDEWTFFGRAGQSVTVVVDPGSSSVLAPSVGYVEVRVLSTNGTALATNSNTSAGQTVVLSDVGLPADGTYRVQVRAAVGHTGNTGNYLITIWEVTADVASLLLSQQVLGRIETPYSVDRWTFFGVAAQQVRFDLVNVSRPGAVFTLTGPNGWIGLSNLTADSDLINLPGSGSYILTVKGNGLQYDITYAFRLIETVQTELDLGTNFIGQLGGSGQAQLFRVTVPTNNPMRGTLSNAGQGNQNELYVRRGAPPTRGDYDYRFTKPGSSNQEIVVPMATEGTWYVLLYAA